MSPRREKVAMRLAVAIGAMVSAFFVAVVVSVYPDWSVAVVALLIVGALFAVPALGAPVRRSGRR